MAAPVALIEIGTYSKTANHGTISDLQAAISDSC
jgi:hypothetical protein